jgi:hypothetical protein
MMDDRDVIERLEPLFPAPENALEACLRLRDRKRRNQRIGAIAVAAIITAALVVSLVSSVDRSKKRPADTGPITPTNVSDLQLSWTAKTDADPRPDLGLQSLAQGDGSLYVITGAHAEISAFSIDCAVDGGGCGPTWTGRLRMPAGACGPIRCVGAMPIGPAVTDGLVLVGSLHRLRGHLPAGVGRSNRRHRASSRRCGRRRVRRDGRRTSLRVPRRVRTPLRASVGEQKAADVAPGPRGRRRDRLCGYR